MLHWRYTPSAGSLSFTSKNLTQSSVFRVGIAPNIKNEALKNLVVTNVKKTMERIGVFDLQRPGDTDVTGTLSGAVGLVESAISPKNLSRMDPTWHPWF